MTIEQSRLTTSERGFHVEAYEKIEFDLTYVDGVFDAANLELARIYRRSGRCLMVVDENVLELYRDRIETYFDHHDIALSIVAVRIAETAKALSTLETIVDAFSAFGLLRKEPVLVVGGGLTTDVAGFACASYRRSTPYVRIPTTLIGLIDASVSMKVAVNHGKHKNRLGAYHPSQQVLLDFGFLATLPEAQIRNGMAELMKIAIVSHRGIFDTLEEHGTELLRTRFGYVGDDSSSGEPDGLDRLRAIAHRTTYDAIAEMLRLEVPNLHEIDLDRVIAFGHTWSPTLELAPSPPLFHGHAISVDMALSATIAAQRGYLTPDEHARILRVFSGLGLSVDSDYLTPDLLDQANDAILQTRDGLLRAAVPRPIGTCHFINDLDLDELKDALAVHQERVRDLPRGGAGLEAFTAPGA